MSGFLILKPDYSLLTPVHPLGDTLEVKLSATLQEGLAKTRP